MHKEDESMPMYTRRTHSTQKLTWCFGRVVFSTKQKIATQILIENLRNHIARRYPRFFMS